MAFKTAEQIKQENRMPTSPMERFLRKNQSKWEDSREKAKNSPGGFVEKPDGRYVAQISKAEIVQSENSGKYQIAWRAVILEGDLVGETIYWWDGLENSERSLEFVAKNLAKFGYDPATFDLVDLPKTLEEIVDLEPVCQMRLKTRNDFQNVFVDKVLDDYEPESDDDAAARAAAKAAEEEAPAKPTRRGTATADIEAAKADKAKRLATKVAPEPEPAKPATKTRTKPAPEPEPEPEEEEQTDEQTDEDDEDGDEEEVDLEVGMTVSFEAEDPKTKKTKELTGIVTKIDEESETATVKVGTKSYPVSFEVLEVLEDED